MAKELGKEIDVKGQEAWAEQVSAALADKDCMDLKYFVRLQWANETAGKGNGNEQRAGK